MQKSRRNFIKKDITGAIITDVPSGLIAQRDIKTLTLTKEPQEKKFSSNDRIKIAVIGRERIFYDEGLSRGPGSGRTLLPLLLLLPTTVIARRNGRRNAEPL